jgi:excisionase family DNA binding protein
MTDKIAYTINEACSATGLSRTTLYELMNSGKLPYSLVGTRRRILRESLEKFIKDQEQTQ